MKQKSLTYCRTQFFLFNFTTSYLYLRLVAKPCRKRKLKMRVATHFFILSKIVWVITYQFKVFFSILKWRIILMSPFFHLISSHIKSYYIFFSTYKRGHWQWSLSYLLLFIIESTNKCQNFFTIYKNQNGSNEAMLTKFCPKFSCDNNVDF